MTLTDLLDLCDQAETNAGTFLTLVIPKRKRARYSRQVRIMPGLLGRNLGDSHGDKPGTIVSVAIADVKRCLMKNLERVERMALQAAEDGNHDDADKWMADFIAVRDRLGGLPSKPSRARKPKPSPVARACRDKTQTGG